MPGFKSINNAKDTSDFILNGTVSTSTTSNLIVSVSSEAIKWVSKLSNFNVDLQCKSGMVPKYRLVCSNCGLDYQVSATEVHNISVGNTDSPWVSVIETFLRLHSHTADPAKEYRGRKFRDVS
jgi:hypothetical protein